MFGSSVRTTSFTGLTSCSGSPLVRTQHGESGDGILNDRQVHEIRGPSEAVAVLDGLGDADDLDRFARGASEPEAFAEHGRRARPVVIGEMVVDDGDTRGACHVRRQEAAAAQDRHTHGLEKPVVDGVHHRREAFAPARHLKTLRHKRDTAEVAQAERRVLREGRPLNPGRLPHAFRQKLVELRPKNARGRCPPLREIDVGLRRRVR